MPLSKDSDNKKITAAVFSEYTGMELWVGYRSGNKWPSDIYYSPNRPGSMGLKLSYDGFSASFSKSVWNEKKNDTHLFGTTSSKDYRFDYFTSRFGSDIYYLNYSGFYLKDPGKFGYTTGAPQTIRPDIKTETFGLSIFYNAYNLFNEFHLDTVFNYSASPKKWGLGLLTLFSAQNFRQTSSYPVIPPADAGWYGDLAGMTSFSYRAASVGLGLGAVIPIKKMTISLYSLEGRGLASYEIGAATRSKKGQMWYIHDKVGLSINYYWDRCFVSLSGSTDEYSTDRPNGDHGLEYGPDISSGRFLVGVKY